MNEAGLNASWIRKDMTHKETQEFSIRVLNHMRERLSDYQEEYGDLYNLEATPAESTAYRLAKHDVEQYPDIITAAEGNGTPYYTNSSHLPVGYTDDIFEALDIQDKLQTLYTSGTVFHAFLGERLPDWHSAAKLVKKVAENYELPYYTLSPTYSICKNHGYISGEEYTCPVCGESTEVYSRITGYYRPVQNWNDGKTQEFRQRKTYNISGGKAFVKPVHDNVNEESKEETVHYSEVVSDDMLLFTTAVCPKCKAAKRMLDDAGMDYTVITAEKSPELAKKYGIRQAPTLVIKTGNGDRIISGLSGIQMMIDETEYGTAAVGMTS